RRTGRRHTAHGHRNGLRSVDRNAPREGTRDERSRLGRADDADHEIPGEARLARRNAARPCRHANRRAWHNPLHRCPTVAAHRMLSRRLRKIGSLIGMLAILMTALAPTISQALTTQQRVDTLLAGYCTAAPANGEHSADSSRKSLQAHLQACGYCS